MSRISDLNDRLDDIAAELKAMSPTTAGGLPNVAGLAAADHVGYRMSLIAEQKGLIEALTAMGGLTVEEAGDFETVTEGTT